MPDHEPTKPDDRKPSSYTTYLYIPCDFADNRTPVPGAPLPNAVNFWSSPFLDFFPKDALDNPIAGTPTTLTAEVCNDGYQDAIGVLIEWLACVPSLAGIAPLGGGPLGSKLVNIPSGAPTVVSCPAPWTPDISAGAHQCLIARCGKPGDNFAPAAALLPAADRHVAQRNLTVVDPALNGNAPMRMQLAAGNPFAERRHFEVRAAAMWLRGDFGAWPAEAPGGLAAFLGSMRAGGEAPGELGKMLRLSARDMGADGGSVKLAHVRRVDAPRSCGARLPAPGALLPGRLAFSPHELADAHGRLLGSLELEAGEEALLDFHIPMHPVGAGQATAHHLTQLCDGAVIGGYTVLAIGGRKQ